MSASTVEPHDKMRARDVSKVARGEQAPRPPKQSPPVSRPPSPSSTTTTTPTPYKKEEAEAESRKSKKERMRDCYDTYYNYHRCIEEKGADAEACKKVADYYKSTCPEWIEGWKIK